MQSCSSGNHCCNCRIGVAPQLSYTVVYTTGLAEVCPYSSGELLVRGDGGKEKQWCKRPPGPRLKWRLKIG